MSDIANKLIDAAPLWVHLIDAFFVLCGLAALAAAVLPKSNKPWRKVLDFLAANFGNARNLWSAAHGKAAPAVTADSQATAETKTAEEPKAKRKTVKDAMDKKPSVLDERL